MFEKKMPACPSCGHYKASGGIFSGSHFYVHHCTSCGENYCYQCRGSNNGDRCPSCSSSNKTTAGIVYLK